MHEMLTSYVFFVYKSDFVLIIYILNRTIMTSCYKLSSYKVVNMTSVFTDNIHMWILPSLEMPAEPF